MPNKRQTATKTKRLRPTRNRPRRNLVRPQLNDIFQLLTIPPMGEIEEEQQDQDAAGKEETLAAARQLQLPHHSFLPQAIDDSTAATNNPLFMMVEAVAIRDGGVDTPTAPPTTIQTPDAVAVQQQEGIQRMTSPEETNATECAKSKESVNMMVDAEQQEGKEAEEVTQAIDASAAEPSTAVVPTPPEPAKKNNTVASKETTATSSRKAGSSVDDKEKPVSVSTHTTNPKNIEKPSKTGATLAKSSENAQETRATRTQASGSDNAAATDSKPSPRSNVSKTDEAPQQAAAESKLQPSPPTSAGFDDEPLHSLWTESMLLGDSLIHPPPELLRQNTSISILPITTTTMTRRSSSSSWKTSKGGQAARGATPLPEVAFPANPCQTREGTVRKQQRPAPFPDRPWAPGTDLYAGYPTPNVQPRLQPIPKPAMYHHHYQPSTINNRRTRLISGGGRRTMRLPPVGVQGPRKRLQLPPPGAQLRRRRRPQQQRKPPPPRKRKTASPPRRGTRKSPRHRAPATVHPPPPPEPAPFHGVAHTKNNNNSDDDVLQHAHMNSMGDGDDNEMMVGWDDANSDLLSLAAADDVAFGNNNNAMYEGTLDEISFLAHTEEEDDPLLAPDDDKQQEQG